MDVPRDEKKANFLEGVAQQAKFVATSIVSVRTLEIFWGGAFAPCCIHIHIRLLKKEQIKSD